MRIIVKRNYLYGNGIDPIALDAQLEGIHAYEPIGTGIDACHNANQSVIAVQEGPSDARALALRNRRACEGMQAVRRVPVRVQAIGSSGFHV